MRLPAVTGVLGILLLTSVGGAHAQDVTASGASPITFGETFTIDSRILGETRTINVYVPFAYMGTMPDRLPVLYMPDGGMREDFLHIAGLVQVSVGNGTMRPFMLVGIENTERRRDLTGPTSNPEDSTIAPVVGRSAEFRAFIRDELMPLVGSRYAVTEESAIVGESLAGLFVVETCLLEPELFDTCIAFDPSLWWNDGGLVDRARSAPPAPDGRLYLASSDEAEIASLTARLADILRASGVSPANIIYEPMPEETHATIYHPAALRAFRLLFKPMEAGR